MDPARILVVRLSAMGDIIHTLPAVATLKNSFPHAHITWAVKPRWASLLRDNPFVDRVVPIKLAPPQDDFDLAIDFQGLIKSAVTAFLARPKRIVGFATELVREKAAGFFYSQKAGSTARHVVEMNLDLAAAAGAQRRRVEFPLPDYPPEGELPDSDFVLASPLAGWKAKQWPPEHYSRLAGLVRERYGWPLVINCAPEEREQVEDIHGCLLNFSSVQGLIGVTRRAHAVVGVDSGPLHLAAALGKPGLALFGPTDPARNGPYGDTFTILRSPEAATSYRRDTFISPSMRAIEPEQAFQALEAQISKQSVILEPHS